ncbi:hypothetical protein KA478_04555 [Patescibacteria group bacterium]|nr:hypothetical protein [Patescibacteria group bacterium]
MLYPPLVDVNVSHDAVTTGATFPVLGATGLVVPGVVGVVGAAPHTCFSTVILSPDSVNVTHNEH